MTAFCRESIALPRLFRSNSNKFLATDLCRVSERDTHLNCYRANGEAALLIASYEYYRRSISALANQSLWQEIQLCWEPGDGRSGGESLYMVTKAYTTATCAYHHKTSLSNPDYYVVNIRQLRGNPEVPVDFKLRSSRLCTVTHLQRTTDTYTVLESHDVFARKPLPSKTPHWLQVIQCVPHGVPTLLITLGVISLR